MAWWDDARIEATVTRNYVCSHLKAREVEQLDSTPGFGDGLTNDTYWEWIEQKARRIFLILVDLEMTEQIFGMIDNSWDDTDLPINPEQVERLTPRFSKDDSLRRLFYFRQFHYILKPLRKGTHINYHDMDIVPIEVPGARQKLLPTQSADKVMLPNEPGRIFCRRHIRLGPEHGLSSEDFQDEIESIRTIENDHLVSYWASYIHRSQGYVLFTPVGALSLKSFLASTPASVKSLEKQLRRYLIMDWIHCLVDTLAFLHSKGLSHGNIRPSTILITEDNHIFYSGFTKLGSELLTGSAEKTSFDQESYVYAAPEQGSRPSTSSKDGRSRQNGLQSPKQPASDYVFSISRRESGVRSPTIATAPATSPYLNAQAADIFSLGCVILELVGFLVKRSSRSFAAHRSAKHKTPGRGGAPPDASFHRNLGQVETWMAELAEDAVSQRKKKDGDIFLSGVPPVLQMVERMLAAHPAERPTAHEVQMRMYDVLTGTCGVAEPHCVHQYSSWGFNFEGPHHHHHQQVASSPDAMSVAGWSSASSHRSSEHSRAGRASNMSGGTDSSQGGGRARGTWRSSMYMGVAG